MNHGNGMINADEENEIKVRNEMLIHCNCIHCPKEHNIYFSFLKFNLGYCLSSVPD